MILSKYKYGGHSPLKSLEVLLRGFFIFCCF
jgi:hypothetical protein